VQCIICGEKTDLVKIFDRVSAGFCAEHYPEAFSFEKENDVPSVRPTAFENPWEKKKVLVESF